MKLHGKTFRVAATAAGGVVSDATRLHCTEIGPRVVGRYAGGTILRGCLVGARTDHVFSFRFVQREADGQMHAGHSVCELSVRDGLVSIAEHFTWETRDGSGVNTFEEVRE
ncbi:MAG: hypothetical protein AB1762_22250 [Gemmatimonadota bacterium]